MRNHPVFSFTIVRQQGKISPYMQIFQDISEKDQSEICPVTKISGFGDSAMNHPCSNRDFENRDSYRNGGHHCGEAS
jgi:hypothetical protein